MKLSEDWRNGTKNSALHHRNTLNFKIYKKYTTGILNVNIYCIFYLINAAFVGLSNIVQNQFRRINNKKKLILTF